MRKKDIELMTCLQTRRETVLGLIYFPFHIAVLPMVVAWLFSHRYITEINANYFYYLIGAVFMLLTQFNFLSRSYETFCNDIFHKLGVIALTYFLVLGSNILISLIIQMSLGIENSNNVAVAEMVMKKSGRMIAALVILGPVAEEMLFRATIFGLLYRYSRGAAYAASILLFSVYHVWSYGIDDPIYFVNALIYVPASFLLCYVYEKTDSIWGSILLHTLVNGIAVKAMGYM